MEDLSDTELYKIILQTINNPTLQGLFILSVLLIVLYLVKKEPFKMFVYFRELKIKKITFAKSLLEADILGNSTNNTIKEFLEVYSFEILHGIKVDKPLMIQLIKFQKKHKDKINWEIIKRAFFYIDKSSPTVKINLHWWDHSMRWFISFFSWLLILISIAMFISAIGFMSQPAPVLSKFFASLVIGTGFFSGGLILMSANFSYHSAIKIKDCLNKSKANKQKGKQIHKQLDNKGDEPQQGT